MKSLCLLMIAVLMAVASAQNWTPDEETVITYGAPQVE